MRDATRGGLSAVLNEWAEASDVAIEIEEEKDNEIDASQSIISDDISIDEIMLTIDEIDSRVAQIKDEIQRILKNLTELHYLSKQYEKNSSNILQKCEQIQSELTHIKEISEKNHSNISDRITNFERLIENNFKLIGKDIENLQKDLSSVEEEVRKLRDILVLKGYIKKEDNQGKL